MKALVTALFLILFTVSTASANGGGHTPVSICHSGNGKNFTYIEPDDNSMKGHKNHKHDVFGLSETECLALNQTPEPTEVPVTPEPTAIPTEEPTAIPTEEPTVEPTIPPTVEPTVPPTVEPTVTPSPDPTEQPTVEPTVPIEVPTVSPTLEPTSVPTEPAPTVAPTEPVATEEPTNEPVPATPVPTPTAGDSSTPTPSPEQPVPTDDGRGTLTPSSGGPQDVAGGTTGVSQTGDEATEGRTAIQADVRVDTLPDTGVGTEPSMMPNVLMAVAGATLAASAWGIRRRT